MFVILANAFSSTTPILVGKAVDLVVKELGKVTPGLSEDLVLALKSGLATTLLIFFATYLGVALMEGLFTFLMRQTIIVVSRLMEYDLKNDLYAQYQHLDTAFYRRSNTGDLMNRVTEDVSRVRMFIGPAIMYAVNLFFTITFSIAIMLSIDVKLTIMVLIPLPILSFIIYYVNTLIERKSSEIQAKLSDLTTKAQETFSGIRVVQAYVQEKQMLHHFERESDDYKEKSLGLAKIDAIYFPVMTFLIGCSLIIVIFVGGKEVGAGRMTAGNIAMFIMYINKLMWPVSSLGWVASLIQRAATSMRRINEFMKQEPALKDEGTIDKKMEGHIKFNDVTFVFPDTGIQALQHLSFEIPKGQRWAIIGRTGSGKSTIAELIMRMYDVTKGSIEVDGLDIRQWKLGNLRHQIGYVPQDVFLFSETVAENIAFGLDKTDQAEVEQFAGYASIDAEISRFAEGYETMVGERGVTLSGGQKQRISIARALIKKPNLLILDDCLSAVDASTEKAIQQQLDQVLEGKTAIIITHRIFSLLHFDNILVLNDGTIAEHGTHEQLLQKRGFYADLYAHQLTEQKERSQLPA
jgi:ATP-binding cassette subfamily B multidrug efflux pump